MSPAHDLGVEGAKVALPVAVTGATWLGMTPQEWVTTLTIIYLIGLLVHQFCKHFMALCSAWERFKAWRASNKPKRKAGKQRGAANPKVLAGAAVGVVMAIATPLVMDFEGKRNQVYLDPIGIPTICYGHTQTAKPGLILSDSECADLLSEDLRQRLVSLSQCIKHPLEPHEWAALGSWTYNVGAGAACSSTLVRLLNGGEPASVWCDELPRWVYAGGRKLEGLVRRREVERRLCLGQGIDQLQGRAVGSSPGP